MKILSIGNDASFFKENSGSLKRQLGYFKGSQVDMVVLSVGKKINFQLENISVWRPGGNNKIFTLFNSFLLCRQLAKKNKFNLVVSQDVEFSGLVGFVVARLFGIPLITQLHGNYLDNPLWLKQRRINMIINIFGKYILKQSRAVRVVSGRIRQQVINDFRINPDHVVSLPIGTDLSSFATDKTVKREPILLFVGRLIEEKSPMLFCRVAGNILHDFPSARAVIMGDGNLRSEMERYFIDLGQKDRVTFTGHIMPIEMKEWYYRSSCLIHTAAWEGWGMPMIESMACGCPVVTTDTGCAGEAVKDGVNGFVVPIDDEFGLLGATRKILEDQALLDKFSTESKIEAQNWSFASISEKINKFYLSYAK